ncbi:pyruvate dehydrogenase complex dihydrolipoamide acetyltransferase [Taibaiella chishuiensis]|uniref:Acetyltransferase component of pyruvate dehydrogenase complex n=1 Tax=Taibaiella chishuiensis TaxID=1434707 RepID=A0A2P8D5X1_9BACT|nr:pyruvate dehydrogenase complex dihydrolipoamide acetyltransferase [Taibaiella chishuiensis]PSK92614.1 pyruvate dehydrogenase E2 component (dihydrolipoamide acetyltransferase) [Taibaiella chishuiensis]
MAEVIRMPLLSDTMKEGVIAEWHKKVGDKVKADDVIAEVETDKATMEVMPYVEGTLLYIGVEKGKAAPVNGVIAIVGKEGEDYKTLLEKESTTTAPAAAPAAAEEKTEAPAAQPKAAPEAAPAPEAKKAKPKSGDATVIRMPLLSDTMKEGKIVAWLKQVGDKVKADDVLAEVETDKATMEVMGYVEGTLLYIGVEAGNAAPVNGIIAIVGKEGTDVAPYLDDDDSSTATAPTGENEAPAATTTAQPAVTPAAEAAPQSDDERLKISPLARKIAKEKGIALNQLHGTGDGGRIIKRDIDNYKPQQAAAAAQPQAAAGGAAVPAFAAPGQESHTDRSLSQMRKVIAQRLTGSKFSAPHFYLRMTIKMDNAIAARKAMNEVSPVKISFNDYIIKAVAMALRKHPAVNSSWMGDFIRENHHIHIGSAVAVDEGLIVPVIKFADQKSLAQIAQEASVLNEKARNKKLQPQEFTGNTFTVSNLGMMDIDEFTAIINPPDSCILAIGKIEPTPVAENGQVVVRNLLKLTLSCDHRVVDGAVGSRFMQTLKAYLENPVTMLV